MSSVSSRRICCLILEVFELQPTNHGARAKETEEEKKGIFKRTRWIKRADGVAAAAGRDFVIEPLSTLPSPACPLLSSPCTSPPFDPPPISGLKR